MDYKSKKVKGIVMNKKINIHETMKEDIHYKILRHSENVESHVPDSKKGIGGSSMFMVTVHPIGGLDEKEIDILIHFILNADWIMYYGIGIEVIKKAAEPPNDIWKHMHISFVTNMMTNVKGIKAFFHGLIKENRMVSIPNHTKDTGTVENISLKIESCGSKFFDTKTPISQCAYALKGAAAGVGKTRDEITEADYNNKTTRWTNLFDDEKECTDEVEQQQWRINRIAFAHSLVKESKKQKNNAPLLIHKKYHIEAAQKYAKDNDMEWTDDIADGTHVHVLATMVTATGETRYELAPGFLNSAIQDDLNCKKKKENYKTILEETLVAHFKGVKAKAERALAKAAGGGASTTTREKNKLINALKLQNQELVSERQELKGTFGRLQEEMKTKISNGNQQMQRLYDNNMLCNTAMTTLQRQLRERDEELALAVMEVEQYRDGKHPMQFCQTWKHLGNPGWGGENGLLEKYKKTKEKAIEMWRSQPHFELAYMGQCTAPLFQPPPQKPPPHKPWKRTREVSTGGQDKRRKRSAASIFLTS